MLPQTIILLRQLCAPIAVIRGLRAVTRKLPFVQNDREGG